MNLSRQVSTSNWLLLILTLSGLITFAAIGILSSQEHTGADAPRCRPIYMYPSYAKVSGFDTSHSKFASKYNLFLYREQGKDKIPDENDNAEYILDGIPVLFIPGNAGSYKQVRSIAAEASNIYHANRNNEHFKGRNLDFFAAHFNEDFTAFHGRTMLDQAEYLNDAISFILSLYTTQTNPPKSIILIGHSMGGVVSRLMLTLPNYVEGSVNTIITLSAPHAAAPATFDGDIMRVYGAIDRFWRAGFNDEQESLSRERLQNVSLISITGGLLDTILPADYTTLQSIVPDTNGFTMYTTGIPGVWTPIDHLAIVWCDQLRKVIASTALEVVDPISPSRTYGLEKRMKIFRQKLLSGFESYASQDFLKGSDSLQTININKDNSRTYSHGVSKLETTQAHILELKNSKNASVFNFLSTAEPSLGSVEDGKSHLYLCNPSGDSLTEKTILDSTSKPSEKKELSFKCLNIAHDVYSVPRSSGGLDESQSSLGGEHSPFFASELSHETLQNYDFIIYISPDEISGDDFALWSLSDPEKNNSIVKSGLLSYLFGLKVRFPERSTLAQNIRFDAITSSLIGYKITFNTGAIEGHFKPFARQWIKDPFETKWHLNLEQNKKLSFHGIAPYTPFKTNPNPLNLQIWRPLSEEQNEITIKIDIPHTLKLWVLRYRLAVVSLPVSIITLTLALQILNYAKYEVFPSFEEGLVMLMRFALPISIFVSLLTPLASNEFFQKLLYIIDVVAITAPGEIKDSHVDPYFLGIHDKNLWFLGPVFMTIALSLVFTINKLLMLLYLLIQSVSLPLIKSFSSGPNITKETNSKGTADIIKRNRRVAGTLVLLAFVVFYVPYQFAYVVCCIVQSVVCVKAGIKAATSIKEKDNTVRLSNAFNYNMSLFVLMLWIVPVNIPVLVVFFHNMAVKWKTPFSSHHNILAILPVLLVISKHVQGQILPPPRYMSQKRITTLLLGYFGFFSLVYGVRHLYWLHYLLNIFFALVFILFYEGSPQRSA